MKKSANERLREKYGIQDTHSEPLPGKQKTEAVSKAAFGNNAKSVVGAAKGTSKPTVSKKPAQIKAQRSESPLFSAMKRFASNPIGTISDAVMNPLDDITERITSPGKKAQQEKKRLESNKAMKAENQTKAGRLVGGMVTKAADDIVSGVAGLGDMTLGTAARAFGWENNPFHQWNELAQTTQEANREYYGKNTANAGKVVQTVDELGTGLVEALPQLAIAYMTAGGSLATEGAGAIAQATGRLAGTEAAQAASKLPGAIKTAQAVTNTMRTNPQFWTSFSDMSGRYYNDAKNDGADDWTATMYALATGVMNAGIEVGGGIQKMPGEMQKSEKAILSLLKSAHEEGMEEPIQGIIERSAENLILGKSNPIFSVQDENAVFNPKTAAREYGTGFAIGGILGAAPAISQGIDNRAAANQNAIDQAREQAAQAPQQAPQQPQAPQPIQQPTQPQNAVQAMPEPQTVQPTAVQDLEAVKQQIGRNPTFDDLVNIYSKQGEAGGQAYQRISEAFERGDLVDTGNSGIYTRAEIEQRQTAMPEEDHIDNRTAEYNSKTSTKPFQLTHPELHPYFAEAAQKLQQEAINSFGSDMPNWKGGMNYYISDGLRRVMNMTGLSRQQISNCCQDIIDNHGAEDYASAKHVEAALDYILTNGAHFQNSIVSPNEAYVQEKGQITGGTDPTSFEYALEHDYGLAISLGEMTEEEAYNQWRAEREARQAQQNASTESSTNTSTPAENTTTEQPQSDLPEGQGAMSPAYPYREAQSQTNSTNPIYTAEERETVEGLRPEDRTHQVRTNADVDAHADERIAFDYDGEKQDLFSGDDKEWDVVDVAVAKRILNEEAKKARESGNWDEVRRLQKEFDAKTSNWGQFGHELSRHANDPATIVAEADAIIGDEPGNGQSKNEILNTIYDRATELANIQQGHTDQILNLIRTLNAQRRTGGLFTPTRTGNTLNKALKAVAERGDFDFLWNVAHSQILNLASDARKISPIEAVKSVRYMSMLSKLTTVMRNLIGNNVFDPVESVSNDVGILADLLMSLRTGSRSTAFDASWASKAKRRGSIEAMQRAYIETALDADTEGIENRWEQSGGRTFKMNSRNPFVRFLSTVEKWQAYALNVTDEFQKGGIEAETQRGIDSLERRGLLEPGALDGHAEETARERTFQNNGRMANSLVGFRNAANNLYSVTDRRGGSFGLGDAILPFARVPANVTGQFLNYSPAGLIKGAKQMLGVMAKGKNATAQEQAAAARAFGRGVNGTAILTLFAAAAANGLLNVADGGEDDDEKDLARLRQTEGITGTQFNISAAQRWLDGKGTDWRNDDDIMNIGFLEPINGLMALGSLIWDSAQDEEGITAGDIASATAESALQAISDLPAVSSLTNIFNNYKYSTADTTGGKIAETAVKFAGDTATSIIPNALSGIAQGMDEGTVRDTYSSEKSGIPGVLENTWNAAKAKIPGEKGRESLPASLDNFGQERKTTASPWMNWLNSNVLPGSITKYQTNRVKSELERLAESGADVSIPNRAAEKKVDTEDGEKKLTYAEKRAYQKTYGGEAAKELNELFQSDQYKGLSDTDKAAAVGNIMSYATAKAKQQVGGKAEDPSWTTKSDGTVAQNAVYNAQYQAVRNTAKQTTGKDSPSDGEVVSALSNRGLDYDTTVKIMAQFMEKSTIQKYENAYADGYDFGTSAAFSGAYYEKSYDFGTTDSGNPKQRGKDGTIAWAQENLGLTYSQSLMLYNYLIKR